MRGLLYRPTALALLLFLLAGADRDRNEGDARVTVWEDLPKAWSWTAGEAGPDDAFTVPALGLSRVPAKYSARGVVVDRSVPFALRAEATLARPAGPPRLILRARGEARLLVDGRVLAWTNPTSPNSAGHEE